MIPLKRIEKASKLEEILPDLWEAVKEKTSAKAARWKGKSPHAAGQDGRYRTRNLDTWTSGFWPGMLWVLYDMTQEAHYRDAAWVQLEQYMAKDNKFHHDVGFQFLPTAVLKYTLTGDTDARRRAIFAANFLAGRFNIACRYIRAWNMIKQDGPSLTA